MDQVTNLTQGMNPAPGAAPAGVSGTQPTMAAGMAARTSGCLEWDAVITESEQPALLILPEGDYLFQVVEVERGQHEGSARLPRCNKATITLEVFTAEGRPRIRTILFMHTAMEWKIWDFFLSIGLARRGEPLRMNWSEVTGAWGRAHFRPRQYTGKDGSIREANEVTKFLESDPELLPPPGTRIPDWDDVVIRC